MQQGHCDPGRDESRQLARLPLALLLSASLSAPELGIEAERPTLRCGKKKRENEISYKARDTAGKEGGKGGDKGDDGEEQRKEAMDGLKRRTAAERQQQKARRR